MSVLPLATGAGRARNRGWPHRGEGERQSGAAGRRREVGQATGPGDQE